MFQGVRFGLGMDLSYKYVNAFLGSDDPANAAEPDATAHLLMDGPLYNTFGVPSSLFIGGKSWRKLTPAAISNGKQSYTYGDERVSWDGYRWSYVNIPNLLNPWAQLGLDIDGEAAGDHSGYSVSMNAAGDRFAVSGPFNDGAGIDSGHARVYQLIDNTWTQLGADIDGEFANDGNSGSGISMNASGDRVAIGATGNDGNGNLSGHTRVYQLIGNVWTQLGADIDGEALGDQSGYSVSMNAAGDRVAIGAVFNDTPLVYNAGHVRVYQLIDNTWTQLGADIDGEAAEDRTGYSISMNAAGDRVAIGAILVDLGAVNRGYVKIYQLINNGWTQMANPIYGEAAEDRNGYSVSMNAAGDRVAMGAIFNDGNGSNSGHVRIFRWNGSVWTQLGANINGEASGDQSGWSISMNAAGDRVAIGAIVNGVSGHVRIYQLIGNVWTRLGADIDGEASGDQSGWSVSMNAAGDRVAIGARLNDENGSNSGHVRIYRDTSIFATSSADVGRPWLATWTNGFSAAKVTPTYTKSTNYPTIP
jgi:hypothetical protein